MHSSEHANISDQCGCDLCSGCRALDFSEYSSRASARFAGRSGWNRFAQSVVVLGRFMPKKAVVCIGGVASMLAIVSA